MIAKRLRDVSDKFTGTAYLYDMESSYFIIHEWGSRFFAIDLETGYRFIGEHIGVGVYKVIWSEEGE